MERTTKCLEEQSDAKKTAIGKYCTYALLSLVIVFFAWIRFRLRGLPLERDEGEFAYVGQLMLRGLPPYKLAYTMKLPGTHAAYALIMALFGQTPSGIHLGLLLVNAATTFLVYLLGARLSGQLCGLVAAASYALLSTSFAIQGMAAHATHFVVLAALAGVLLLLTAMESRQSWQLFASGLLLGLAVLMKQPGIAFAIFCGLYLVKEEFHHLINWKDLVSRVAWYVMGVLLPVGIMCGILLLQGVFKTFSFWVFDYAREYGSEANFSRGIHNFQYAFSGILEPAMGVWLVAAVGLAAFFWHRESRRHAGFIGGLLVFSFLGVSAGLFFRQHYFILVLPAVALLTGIAVQSVTQALACAGSGLALTAVPVLLFFAAFSHSIILQQTSLFETDPLVACHRAYGDNPFPEAIVIAQYLRSHTPSNDRIAVLGSEPEIYFYARLPAATGFIYVYGLMERQKYAYAMQKQMIQEIETAQPQFIVFVGAPVSWLPKSSEQQLSFFSWTNSYLNSQYEVVGIADRFDNHTEHRWDDEASSYQPSSQNVVEVFKRKH